MTSNHVVIALPVLLLGGTEIQVLILTKALLSGGYRVTLCCYYEHDTAVADLFAETGASVKLMRLRRDSGLLHLLKELSGYFKEVNPDILHVQYLAPGLVPIIAARLAGIRTIFATVHIAGNIAYGGKAKGLLRMAAKLCTAFFCVSKGVEEFWFGSSELFDPEKPNKKRKHFTIYNAVDIDRIEKAVTETNKDDLRMSMGISGRRVIGIVGRLAYQKGHAVLFDAMPELIKQFPDVVLLIVGDGPDRTSLEQRAESLQLENNIIFLGQKSPEEVYRLYSIMDIFVMPSLYEGFGLSAAEAMAAGLPVVASRVHGLEEIIEHGKGGILVSPDNAAMLAKSLIELLSDEENRQQLTQRARERVDNLFSLNVFNGSWLGAYRGLQQSQ